jgi:hypothetical protein
VSALTVPQTVSGRSPVGHYRPGSRDALPWPAGGSPCCPVSRQRELSRASTGRTDRRSSRGGATLVRAGWTRSPQHVKGTTSCPRAKHAQKPKRRSAAKGMIDGQEQHRVRTAAVPHLHLKRATARPGTLATRDLAGRASSHFDSFTVKASKAGRSNTVPRKVLFVGSPTVLNSVTQGVATRARARASRTLIATSPIDATSPEVSVVSDGLQKPLCGERIPPA